MNNILYHFQEESGYKYKSCTLNCTKHIVLKEEL